MKEDDVVVVEIMSKETTSEVVRDLAILLYRFYRSKF